VQCEITVSALVSALSSIAYLAYWLGEEFGEVDEGFRTVDERFKLVEERLEELRVYVDGDSRSWRSTWIVESRVSRGLSPRSRSFS